MWLLCFVVGFLFTPSSSFTQPLVGRNPSELRCSSQDFSISDDSPIPRHRRPSRDLPKSQGLSSRSLKSLGPGASQHQQSDSPVTYLDSTDAYLRFLESCSASNSLAVVKFTASWCRTCSAFSTKFDRLAQTSPFSHPVSFAGVEFTVEPKLCRSLGITHLPSVQLYDGSRGKVDSFSCSPKRFPEVEKAINKALEKVNKEKEIDQESEQDVIFGGDV